MPSLANRYPDLLPTLDDAALNRVVTDLDRAYGPDNPDVALPPELRANLAHTLAQRAVQPLRPLASNRRLRLPHASRRTGLVALLLAAVLGGGALGLAIHDQPGYTDPYQVPYGYSPHLAALMAQYGHAINASRRACGYTVTLRRAYADANRITVAFAIQGPPGRTFLSLSGTGSPTLISPNGTKLRWLGDPQVIRFTM